MAASVLGQKLRRTFIRSDLFSHFIFSRRLHDVRPYTPRRSFLYIPGNEQRKVSKASSLNSDCVVLDCEDGVAANKKAYARNSIHSLLGQLNCGSREVCLDAKISNIAKARNGKLGLITQVESALGLLNLRAICEHGKSDSRMFKLEALVFGSDDFLVSIGASRTQDAKELIFARQAVVVHAKAFGLQAIDMVYINFKDPEGLKAQAEEGAKFGYTGKQIIHPGQIDIVNDAFSPSEEKLKWASDLVNAFQLHEKEGKGAIDFHGYMIDMPTVQQARNVLRLAEATKRK
ncbi:citramalyl-CoA lyase, mitochondrial-like isoform X3 [Montipora capricornis]|uniref:citramalyl-CoA lyase, mitochondrial-like isoform X2 n=1 Tax=Montipora foliosa TaxID=591990 RepID=UPI0035F1E45C